MANFEEKLKKLENIVDKLDSGDIPLNTAVEVFEEGIKLSKECAEELQKAERKVEILVQKGSEGKSGKGRKIEKGKIYKVEEGEAESGDDNDPDVELQLWDEGSD